MTVSNVSRRVAYTGNAVTTEFAVPFQYFELQAYLDGVLLTVGVDYISNQVATGLTGSITFTVAPLGGAAIVIVGATVKVQETDLVAHDSAPAESYERALDRLTMISQELELLSAQSIRSPVFGSAQPFLNFDDNPGAFVAVNEFGQLYLPPLFGPTSPYALLVADAASSGIAAATVAAATATAQAGIATTQAGLATTAYDNFDDRFLGAFAANPTLDNDGNDILVGALYFNTTTNTMRVRTSVATWIEAASSNNQRTDAVTFVLGGSPAVLTPGVKGDLTIPFNCELTGYTLLANVSGNLILDIWKDTYANFQPTVADTITAAAKPTLTAALKSTDAVLTGWNKTLLAGDILRINVDSAATITRATLTLSVLKG